MEERKQPRPYHRVGAGEGEWAKLLEDALNTNPTTTEGIQVERARILKAARHLRERYSVVDRAWMDAVLTLERVDTLLERLYDRGLVENSVSALLDPIAARLIGTPPEEPELPDLGDGQ